ncbi:MAG: sulfatase [Candidatus Hydrogenedentes bacterium]|nr:sulfatase [Candidatus Hydrogenedentota bacterium]
MKLPVAHMACFLALFLCACGRQHAAPPPVAPEHAPAINVVLISLDTLRADRLSCYGYSRETTPNLDRWAREEAVLFENAITPETWTLPAHMSMFTGLFPQHHGVSRDANLAANVVTLPQLLQQHGYATGGFTGHTWWLRPDRGFGRGFDHYDNAPEMFRHVYKTRELLYAWLAQEERRPLFVFLHSYDLHYKIKELGYERPYDPDDEQFLVFSKPYLAEQPFQSIEKQPLKASELLKAWREHKIAFTAVEADTLDALYDDTLRMLDQALADCFAKLKTMDLYDSSFIIVTADHGEGLGERGYYDHEDVWEEEARVPLLIRFPQGTHAGKRVAGQVQLIDLFPTVVDLLGLQDAPQTDGKSLLPMIDGGGGGHEFAFIRNGAGRLGVRSAEWQLHWRPQDNQNLLFHLPEDPGEQHDRFNELPLDAKPLREAANQFFGLGQSGWHIEVRAPRDTPWRGTLRLSSSTPIEQALRFDSWGNATMSPAGGEMGLTCELGAAAPEHLVVRAAPGELTLQLESVSAFTFLGKDLPHLSVTKVEEHFDTLKNNYPRPEARSINQEPVISVWYSRSRAVQPAPETLPAATREQLDALGYGHTETPSTSRNLD